MKAFDYSFLQHLVLPEGLSSLLISLNNLNSMFNRRFAIHALHYKKIQADALEHAVQAVEWLGGPAFAYRTVLEDIEQLPIASMTAGNYLHMIAPLLSEDDAASNEKSQALGLAFSAYEQAQQLGISPLLLIPCLILDVICIFSSLSVYPEFSALPLARRLFIDKDYAICKYVSFESTICKYCTVYYPAQAVAVHHWAENGNEYLPYIEVFLSMLYLSFKTLKAPTHIGHITKRARVEALIKNSGKPISKGEICAALPDISPTTVEAALGAMVKSGAIRRIGATRGARYVKS